jgi:predicted nucleic acid-binding protein
MGNPSPASSPGRRSKGIALRGTESGRPALRRPDLLPVTDSVARSAGATLRTFRRSHPGIDIADYLIAATAEVGGLGLVTLNIKHFPMVSDLRPAF